MPEWEHTCDRCGSPTDRIEYPDGDERVYCGQMVLRQLPRLGDALRLGDVLRRGRRMQECAPLYVHPDKPEAD